MIAPPIHLLDLLGAYQYTLGIYHILCTTIDIRLSGSWIAEEAPFQFVIDDERQ